MKKMVFENWTEYNKQLVNQQFFYKVRAKIKLFIESLILAQDERWRRA